MFIVDINLRLVVVMETCVLSPIYDFVSRVLRVMLSKGVAHLTMQELLLS